MADEKLVSYKLPKRMGGAKVQTTQALKDRIEKGETPGPTVLSMEQTRAAYARGDATERPGDNASTAEWREFRLANGYGEDEVDGLGRNDLRDLDDR